MTKKDLVSSAKKEFVLSALEEVELDSNIDNLVNFWENQFDLFNGGSRGPEIHEYTWMKFRKFK